MATNRTCFVISPIGEDDSSTRRNADDVFDLLIEPAVEPFHFDVIRADKIPGPSSITQDVIRLVQEADLCVVDLTEGNPNVFYECGRRHEAGKPAILIIRRGEKIPFDLAGIRTIPYDISDPRTTRETVKTIQGFVREIEQTGFEEVSSGATLTNITETLSRIERKVNSLPSSSTAVGSPRGVTSIERMFVNPQKAMQDALMAGDIETVVALLPRIERILGISDTLVIAASVAALNGEEGAVELLYRALESTDDILSIKSRTAALTALVQYYVATDREVDGAGRLPPIAQDFLESSKLSDEETARVFNQLGMVQHGAERYEEALENLERAVELSPLELSYWFNLSIVYEKLGLQKKALETVDKFLTEDNRDPDHLSHAYEILKSNHLDDRAERVLNDLRHADPAKASFIELKTGAGLSALIGQGSSS